jgi:hypothetical protein
MFDLEFIYSVTGFFVPGFNGANTESVDKILPSDVRFDHATGLFAPHAADTDVTLSPVCVASWSIFALVGRSQLANICTGWSRPVR